MLVGVAAPGGTWPLVGRATELDRVSAALADPDVGGILLSGPAGVGKTRLARECLELATRAGFATSWAAASQAAGAIPLGALAHLLPRLPGGELRIDVLAAARDALIAAAEGKPLVLAVDDAHLLDSGSATLVAQLASDRSAFLVATMRSGEAAPDPIVGLWKEGVAERIELGPVSESAFERLTEIALGGPVEGATVRDLWEVSRGNVLFLREVLLGAIDGGTLRADRGLWRMTGTPALAPRLVELIATRLEDLDDDERRALELVALGEPIGVRLLETLVSPGALQALERKGLLAVRQEHRRIQAALAHPLHGEVLRSRLGVLGAEAAHVKLAEAVSTTGARRREDVLRVASWRLAAHQPSDAALLLEAAKQAQASFDLHLAERLAVAAREAGGGAEAGCVLGQVVADLGRHEEAETLLAVVAREASGDAERALVALTRADNLFHGLGRHADAAAVAQEAAGAVADPDWEGDLIGLRAVFDLWAGLPRAALAGAEGLLARESGRSFVRGALVVGSSLAVMGRTEEALEIAARGMREHMRIGEQPMLVHSAIHMVTSCLALSLAGRLGEAETLARGAYNASVAARATLGQATFGMSLAQSLIEQGKLRSAAARLVEAAQLFGRADLAGRRVWCLAAAARALALGGWLAEARSMIAELESIPETPVKMFEIETHRGRAWVAAAGGDFAGARAHLQRGAEDAEARGLLALAVGAWHDLARLGAPAWAAPRLRSLAEQIDGKLASARAAHATALASDDPEAQVRAADDLAELGARLDAAEALTVAATRLDSFDRGRDAATCRARAAELAGECEDACTPVMARHRRSPSLSRREREVAELASAGRSSREIAEALFLSVRTVDNHLRRTYSKLGIAGRSELSARLERD